MRIIVLFGFCLLAPSSIFAQTMETFEKANGLGTVLAAEEKCGFIFDQEAISAWIDANVPASDMGFASTLDMVTQAARSRFDEMSASSLTAHCRQIERTAKHYGFLN